MDNAAMLSDNSMLLLSRLPGITQLDELVTFASSLLNASLYVVDGHGKIIRHSDKDNVTCPSWLSAVGNGSLHAEHLKSTLAPSPTCNIIRDTRCTGKTCARLSIPISLGEGILPGAVLFFFWNGDPSYEQQCLSSVLAGAFSAMLQKQHIENAERGSERTRLMRELMDYKPGLKTYYLAALKSAGLLEPDGHFHLCAILPQKDAEPKAIVEELNSEVPGLCFFESGKTVVGIHNTHEISEEDFKAIAGPVIERMKVHACYSIGFSELLELRFISESTFLALKYAMEQEPEQYLHKADHFMFQTVLHRISHKLPPEEIYPDGFLKLLEYDSRNNRTYIETLSAYLDNGRNANAAAKQIYAHRNTVMQQLERIEQIMGFSLEDNEMCLYLQFCIRMHRLQNT